MLPLFIFSAPAIVYITAVPVNNGRDVARNHANALLIFCLLAMASGGGRLFAADVFVPPKEAPTTIFSTKLGSADVDLSLLGSWTAGVSFGAGLLLAPGLPAQALDSFPAIDQGFIFSQTPDITITLELLKRFYLNVSVLGNFSNNTIQLGYKGAPNEPLQSVVVGNTGVAIPSSQLVQIPSQPFGSLGAMSQFTGTMIFISHDVHFIRSLANHVVHVKSGRVTHYPGSYQYYLDKSASLVETTMPVEPQTSATGPRNLTREQKRLEAEQRQARYRVRKAQETIVHRLEKEITEFETEQGNLTAELQDPATYEQNGRIVEINCRLAEIRERLPHITTDWESAAEVLARLEGAAD